MMKHKNVLIVMTMALLVTLGATAVAADSVKEGESLQAAIDAAADGALILVEPGTFVINNLTISGKSIILRSIQGPSETVLRIVGTGLIFTPRSGNQSTIEGFTLKEATHSAVDIDGASPTFKNCFFIDNMNYYARGGTCRIQNSAPIFDGCSFFSGWSDSSVGGVECLQSHPTFINCSFRDNQTPHIENKGGTASIINCTFFGSTRRPIIFNEDSNVTIVNTIIRLNWSNGATNEQPA